MKTPPLTFKLVSAVVNLGTGISAEIPSIKVTIPYFLLAVVNLGTGISAEIPSIKRTIPFFLLAITDGMKSANNTMPRTSQAAGMGTYLQLIFFKTGKGFLSFTICDMLF